jgi:hypothetical protein
MPEHRTLHPDAPWTEVVANDAARLVFAIDGGSVHANLRRPPGVDLPPYVVLIPGLDSTKEEFYFFEQSIADWMRTQLRRSGDVNRSQ